MDALTTLSRVPRRPPRADVALVAVLLMWAVIEPVGAAGPGAPAQRLAFAIGVTVPLIWRRQAPITVLTVLIAVLLVRVLALTGQEDSTFPFPSLLVATFSVALHPRHPAAAIGGGIATLAAMSSLYPLGYYGAPAIGQVFVLGFFVVGAWAAGWLVRVRVAQVLSAQEEAAARAVAAVAAERERIARELHDVVAHSLSIVAVQAGAAEELIDLDPRSARRHIAAARSTARQALTEMRHVLDVLRDDREPDRSPQPTLEHVADLVEDVRAAGLPVTLRTEGTRGEVPPGVDLAGFRIVQEALTNVRRHAPGATADVRIGYQQTWIEVQVRDSGGTAPAGPGSGRGLIGMRERARLYGGTVSAEPAGDGFAVHARLPRHPA